MKNIPYLLLLLAAVLTFACGRETENPLQGAERMTHEQNDPYIVELLKKHLDEEALQLLTDATCIEHFSTQRRRDAQFPKRVGGFSIRETHPELNATQHQALVNLLLESNNYRFGVRKRTPFTPRHAFILSDIDEEELIVLVAPHTAQIRFIYYDGRLTLECDPGQDSWHRFLAALPVTSPHQEKP